MNVSSATVPSSTAVQPTSNSPPFSTSNKKIIEISDQEKQQIQQLKSRDQVVRAHEAAHIAAGGGLVSGGASFSFQRGPDGVQYAIGGEVSIDASKVSGNPEATLQKAQKIQAAALAPAQPSAQDRTVAARAAQMTVEARAEINQQQTDSTLSSSTNESSTNTEVVGKLIDLTA